MSKQFIDLDSNNKFHVFRDNTEFEIKCNGKTIIVPRECFELLVRNSYVYETMYCELCRLMNANANLAGRIERITNLGHGHNCLKD